MTFGLLVNEAVTNGTLLITRIFSWSLLRFFGRISYGLYVFHWPVYLMLAPVFNQLFVFPGNITLTHLSTSLLTTGIAIIISLFSFRYYESYFLRLKDKWS